MLLIELTKKYQSGTVFVNADQICSMQPLNYDAGTEVRTPASLLAVEEDVDEIVRRIAEAANE